MSSESDYAWRMARLYGAEIARLDRPHRVAWTQQRLDALQNKNAEERSAHMRDCETCRTGGEFCLEGFSITPEQSERYDAIRRLEGVIAHEKHDQEYADNARVRSVIYEHHIDGFCSYWQNLRHRLFVIADHRCQRCGERKPLEAHHRHYDTLGFEDISDLEALCRKCHSVADQQRGYTAGLATYASQKYGEYWQEEPIECLEEEFDRWLESKGDYE